VRAKAYAEAARTAGPQAQQMVDRWHPLWHKLGEYVDKVVAVHHRCIKLAFTGGEGASRWRYPTDSSTHSWSPGPNPAQ